MKGLAVVLALLVLAGLLALAVSSGRESAAEKNRREFFEAKERAREASDTYKREVQDLYEENR